jgi:exonuclease VII large subunit
VRAAKEQNQSLHEEKMVLERRLRDAEEDAAKRISEMEHKIATLEENISKHQRDTKEWMSVAECYERTYTQCSTGLNQAILFLQGLSAENCLQNGGSAVANP